MPGLVAIEVTTVTPDQAQWVAEMVRACSASLDDGECVSPTDNGTPMVRVPSHRARVTWIDETRAVVAVYEPETAEPKIVRTLGFTATDEPREKWRTVGFTTALLTRAPVDSEPPLQPNTHDSRALPSFSSAVTARLLAASALVEHGPKAGAQLRIEGRAWQAPWLFGVTVEYAAAKWDEAGVDGSATWAEIGAGGALFLEPTEQLQMFTRIDVLAQQLMVGGEKKADADSVSFWQPSLRLAVDFAWQVGPTWYTVLGMQGTFVRNPVDVRVDDKLAVHVPALSAGVNLGLQYRF